MALRNVMPTSPFMPYAAGNKRYGSGLRDAPNIGPVDKLGYRERDLMSAQQKRQGAVKRRLDMLRLGRQV